RPRAASGSAPALGRPVRRGASLRKDDHIPASGPNPGLQRPACKKFLVEESYYLHDVSSNAVNSLGACQQLQKFSSTNGLLIFYSIADTFNAWMAATG